MNNEIYKRNTVIFCIVGTSNDTDDTTVVCFKPSIHRNYELSTEFSYSTDLSLVIRKSSEHAAAASIDPIALL